MINDNELQIILKYEMNKLMSKLIERVAIYDCSTHQEECRNRDRHPLECKGAQATTRVVLDILRDWEYEL